MPSHRVSLRGHRGSEAEAIFDTSFAFEQFGIQVTPLWVRALDQRYLSLPRSGLDLLLTFERAEDLKSLFEVDQFPNVVSIRETGAALLSMLLNSAQEVIRHSRID